MGQPDLTIDDADELTIEITKGNKQWVARVTDTDDQYDLDRDFISPYGRGTETVAVADGGIVEVCWHSHGGREKGRKYYVVAGGDLCEIDRDQVERALDATVVTIDADSEAQTHDCETCGKTFDNAHGLAVHEGMVHGDEASDATGDDDHTPETPDVPQPVATDGGTVTDGGNSYTDWDKVAGGEPSRNGTRRIVSGDEAQTPYEGRGWYKDELLGVGMVVGTGGNDDTIGYVSLKPQVPRRALKATGSEWIARLGVAEGGYDDLHDDGDVDEPLAGYQPETTADYREANPEDPRGDGVYARDSSDDPLTAQIADVVTREGGRIPVDFSAAVQNEGYARSRDWRVYAPGRNPYHVAAAVTDLLQDADGVHTVRVSVADRTAADIADRLRATGIGYVFDRDEEADLIERALRESRWQSGLPSGRQRVLAAAPGEARERADEADWKDKFTDYESLLGRLAKLPGDAWDYYEVTIHIDEEADKPYYG